MALKLRFLLVIWMLLYVYGDLFLTWQELKYNWPYMATVIASLRPCQIMIIAYLRLHTATEVLRRVGSEKATGAVLVCVGH